jgi:hypothetical protein
MKRTTIFAEEEILLVLKRIAREREISLAEVVRRALEQFISREQDQGSEPSFLGVGSSGRSDISERHEHLLWIEEDEDS